MGDSRLKYELLTAVLCGLFVTGECGAQTEAPLAWAGLKGVSLVVSLPSPPVDDRYQEGESVLFTTTAVGHDTDWRLCGSPLEGSTCLGPEIEPATLYGQEGTIKRMLSDSYWEITTAAGRSLYARSSSSWSAPLRRLPKAFLAEVRARWVGATFYHDASVLLAVYSRFSPLSEWAIHPLDTYLTMRHLAPFVIRDVVLGDRGPYSLSALYLVVQPVDVRTEHGAVEIGGGFLSGTRAFTNEDMQTFARWPSAIQVAVRNQQVVLGMIPGQIVMSRGVPRQRDRVIEGKTESENWCYPGLRLTLRRGRVVKILERTAGGGLLC